MNIKKNYLSHLIRRYSEMNYMFFFVSLVFGVCKAPDITLAQSVTVTVDLAKPDMVSGFEIGLTHVHTKWDQGHYEAVSRAESLLADGCRFQNQHITHWGVGNPNPSPNVYDWSSLDARIDLIRSIDNSIPIITFCGAPGWMKDEDPSVKWEVEIRVRDRNVADFADLCKKVAQRYPDVKYFQVWNEMKGYWNSEMNNWDYIRYTDMYNAVYDAVKSVRSDAFVGGLYLCINEIPVRKRDWAVIDYWLENKQGADFICFDHWLEGWPPGGLSEKEMMTLTNCFGDIVNQLREKTDLPVWISEYYGGRSDNPRFTAANHASCYYHSLKSGATLGLLWDGVGLGQLFSKTESPDGGQQTPHYQVISAFNNHFGPGTQLYMTKSSSSDIEVLASFSKTMLINKRPAQATVLVNGTEFSLEAYEVRVIDTPAQ